MCSSDLARAGHTEATVDLCKIADMYPAGIVCEIIKEDGDMARMPDLEIFADKHSLKILSIAQIIAYRRHNERSEERRVGKECRSRWSPYH